MFVGQDESRIVHHRTGNDNPLLLSSRELIRPMMTAVSQAYAVKRILGRATVIVDSVDKCLENGEAGWAVRTGLLAADTIIPLGELLAEPRTFAADAIVVADLTGLPVQDAAIAGAVWRVLAAR